MYFTVVCLESKRSTILGFLLTPLKSGPNPGQRYEVKTILAKLRSGLDQHDRRDKWNGSIKAGIIDHATSATYR